MEVQWCWIEVSGHLQASVALLLGKEESLVPTEQEVGWFGHYVVHRARIQSLYRLSLCGLVVRVSGYRYRGPGFDPRRYQIF